MRCPVCRAENSQSPQCRRCRADLSLLWQVEEERRRVLEAARAFAVHGDFDRALAVADGIDALRHDQESLELLAVINLLRRDFAGAWRTYQAARSNNPER